MGKYRTALGRNIDMDSLVARNENVRAVGNMKVNARGDTIDSHGKVIVPVTQKVGEAYQKTVGNKSAQVRKAPPTVRNTKPTIKEELTAEEKQILESEYEDDLEIERIKAEEAKRTNGRKN